MRILLPLLVSALLASCAQLPQAPIPAPPPGQDKLVVVDIDGTLTPDVMATNEVRPGAAQALQAYVDKGYSVAYVTTRWPIAQGGLPAWLVDNHFPAGLLHPAQTSQERDDPAGYKETILLAYQNQGWNIAYAYGDSSTDFLAYNKAGVPRGHIFALKRRSEEKCLPGDYQTCLNGWEEHMGYVMSVPPAAK
ncbi:LNS2 domain-containing protein [Rugamonas apoptosis]|uniref:LNS2/PITP domain-containing protein n=1 Tax=Rugamonas apoptosis TaxID=2758570 RepID=A0A7W2FBE7_9BURK|nr:hypothetical protein [Rugamonas apoptosis]MBA5688631.1 hypothetical protein [Rugamonas apoptosis]